MNSAALSGSVDASTATAYSIGQQLVISAWDVLFAVILVSWVFGWTGGKALVESSYTGREGEKPRAESETEADDLSNRLPLGLLGLVALDEDLELLRGRLADLAAAVEDAVDLHPD